MSEKQRSDLWLLIPVIFGVLAGIITYFVIRRDDPKLAKKCIYAGFASTAFWIVLIIVVLATAPESDIPWDTADSMNSGITDMQDSSCKEGYILVGDICESKDNFTADGLEELMKRTPEQIAQESIIAAGGG